MSKPSKSGTLFLLVDKKLLDAHWGNKLRYLTYVAIAHSGYKKVEFRDYNRILVKNSKKYGLTSVTFVNDDIGTILTTAELNKDDSILIVPSKLTIRLGTISHPKVNVLSNTTSCDSIVDKTIDEYFGVKSMYLNDVRFLTELNSSIELSDVIPLLKRLNTKLHGKTKVNVTKELASDITDMMLLLGIDKKFLSRITLDCLTSIVKTVVDFKRESSYGTTITQIILSAVYSCYNLSIIRTNVGSGALVLNKWIDNLPYFKTLTYNNFVYCDSNRYLLLEHISQLFSICKMKECFTLPISSITIEQKSIGGSYSYIFINKEFANTYPTNKLLCLF